MPEKLTFTIAGDPAGWQRAGINFSTGAHYTQGQTKTLETLVAWEYRRKYKDRMFPLRTPIALIIRAYLPIPPSKRKSERERMIKDEIRPTVKPDWDNIGKLISDALNGVAYADDKDIVFGAVQKAYSSKPRTVVTLWEFIDERGLAENE